MESSIMASIESLFVARTGLHQLDAPHQTSRPNWRACGGRRAALREIRDKLSSQPGVLTPKV